MMVAWGVGVVGAAGRIGLIEADLIGGRGVEGSIGKKFRSNIGNHSSNLYRVCRQHLLRPPV